MKKPLRESKNLKMGLIASAAGAITVLHYFLGISPLNHQVYGKLYYGPVILAALWFGMKGGLSSALIIDLLLLPHLFFAEGQGDSLSLVLWEIPPLNLAGLIIGYVRDREQEKAVTLSKEGDFISLGKASSFMAHEMKNISLGIHGFVRLIKRRGRLPGDLVSFLETVEEESSRMERLSRDMLALSTFPPLKKERLEIAGFLRQILLVSGELAREREIDFRSEIQENLPPLWLDADRMKEVLINLTQNAAHSTPPGGTVTLRALKNNGRVVIQVADTGGGIPSRDMEKIFLPFFTTKEKGTGLGLAISKKIVEAHGATIEVDSREGRGTEFIIAFPPDQH